MSSDVTVNHTHGQNDQLGMSSVPACSHDVSTASNGNSPSNSALDGQEAFEQTFTPQEIAFIKQEYYDNNAQCCRKTKDGIETFVRHADGNYAVYLAGDLVSWLDELPDDVVEIETLLLEWFSVDEDQDDPNPLSVCDVCLGGTVAFVRPIEDGCEEFLCKTCASDIADDEYVVLLPCKKLDKEAGSSIQTVGLDVTPISYIEIDGNLYILPSSCLEEGRYRTDEATSEQAFTPQEISLLGHLYNYEGAEYCRKTKYGIETFEQREIGDYRVCRDGYWIDWLDELPDDVIDLESFSFEKKQDEQPIINTQDILDKPVLSDPLIQFIDQQVEKAYKDGARWYKVIGDCVHVYRDDDDNRCERAVLFGFGAHWCLALARNLDDPVYPLETLGEQQTATQNILQDILDRVAEIHKITSKAERDLSATMAYRMGQLEVLSARLLSHVETVTLSLGVSENSPTDSSVGGGL